MRPRSSSRPAAAATGPFPFEGRSMCPRGGPDGGDGGKGGDVVFTVAVEPEDPLPPQAEADLQGGGRRPRRPGRRCTARTARTSLIPVPPGTVLRDPRTGRVRRGPHAGRGAVRLPARRPRRQGQLPLRHLRQPGAPLRAEGHRGGDARAEGGAAPHRGHRPRRAAERRQVDAALRPHQRASPDRRLSLHDADAAASACCACRSGTSSLPTSPASSRGPRRARGWACGSSATSSAAPRCCTSWTSPRRTARARCACWRRSLRPTRRRSRRGRASSWAPSSTCPEAAAGAGGAARRISRRTRAVASPPSPAKGSRS